MKRRIIGVLILISLLINTLSATFIIRPSLATGFGDKEQISSLGEKASGPISQAGVGSSSQDNDLSRDVSQTPSSQQSQASGNSGESSWTNGNKWNFSDPCQWSNMAYLLGNKTRLTVGLAGDKSNGLSRLEEMSSRHRAKIVNTILISGKVRAAVVELSLPYVTGFVEDVRSLGFASYVEPNVKVQAQLFPNDPAWPLQWGPQRIEADTAWDVTVGSHDILVAIVDTGVCYTHPDLSANYVPLGYDWVNNDVDPNDDHGHGTHCAGIVAAVLNNYIGIAGLAQVSILAEKVLTNSGWGYSDWIASGIVHATDCGAKIISMSLGGYSDSELIHEAVRYAYDAGVLVVAAAGNDGTNTKLYPAAYEEVVAVSATDSYDDVAYFSNWGDWIELAAPGVNIYSTVPWGYESWSGTSMACPHVAGVAALVWSLYPNRTREWVRLRLRFTVYDLGDPGFDVNYGYGRISARQAVWQSPPAHELIVYGLKTPPYVEPGASVIVNATILNFGNDEVDVQAQLIVNNTIVDSTTLGFLAGGSSTTVSAVWNVATEGAYNVTFFVPPFPNELNPENNAVQKYVYAGFPVKGVVLHSAGSNYDQIIENWQVLNNEWRTFGDTMVYIDYVSLNRECITYNDIAASDADVLIISCAASPDMGYEFTDSEINAIERYVHEGHGLIATAGTFYYMVPNNNRLGRLFGISEATDWTGTYTDLLHLTNRTHPLFRNVPNPLVFPQVGTSLPYDGRWDSDELAGGKYLALGHSQESAIVAYRGLVYISPWLEIIPAYYTHQIQLIYNAILWSRYQKPQHDLVTSLEAPKTLKPDKSTILNATVINAGLSDETNVQVTLTINGITANLTTVSKLAAGDSYVLRTLWNPTAEGIYNVTAYTVPVPGEDDTANNVQSARVLVSTLTIALFQNYNPWGYTSNEDALDRYGVPYVKFSSSDFGHVDLDTFAKVVIASDQDQAFYNGMDAYRTWFEDYASRGGILEVHAADYGWNYGSWAGSMPGGLQRLSFGGQSVTVLDWLHPLLNKPNAITDSELDNWLYSTHGAFSTYPRDAHVIMIEDSTAMPACLELEYGIGTIIATLQPLEWAYARRLSLILENSLLYAPPRHAHELVVELNAPASVEPGSSVLLESVVYNRGLNAESAELRLLINGSIVDSIVIPTLEKGESRTLGYLWTPTAEGTYDVTAHAPPVPGEDNIQNNIAATTVWVGQIKYVLFDQTHGTDNISNYDEWVTSLSTKRYVIETHTANPVTPAVLEDIDVFVISQAHVTYTADELSAIQDFVLRGGGLLVIGDDDTWLYSDLTGFAGIAWRAGGTSGMTTDITLHPVTAGVASVYLVAPIAEMNVTQAAQGLVRDISGNTMLAVSEQSRGKVAGFSDEDSLGNSGITQADNMRLANNLIDWLAVPTPFEHELSVTLQAPAQTGRGGSVLLNATVYNVGISNETNVELSLLINKASVHSETISNLPSGSFCTISYLWTPPKAEAYYNVTAYAPPVPDENLTVNNQVTRIVYVSIYSRTYLPNEWIGGGNAMGWHADDASWAYSLAFDFPFYGTNYRTVYISSNGLITLAGPDVSFQNSISELAMKLAIAPAWDDWTTDYPFDIFVWQNSEYVYIRWWVTSLHDRSITANFEAILASNGTIRLNYRNNNGPISSTVGISNGIGDCLAKDLTNLNYLNTIAFEPPLCDIAVVSVVPSSDKVQIGNTVDVAVVAENQGDLTETFAVTAYASFEGDSGTGDLVIGNGTTIYPDPSDYRFDTGTANVGDRFNVTLKIRDVMDLGGWQICIYFNDTVINVTRWFEPKWDPSYVFYGKSTVALPTPPEVAYAHLAPGFGTAKVAGLLFPPPPDQPPFAGSGMLCMIEFEIIAVPAQEEILSSNLIIDNYETYIVNSEGYEVPTIKENGYYELAYGGPPPPPGAYKIGTMTVTNLAPGAAMTLVFTWETRHVPLGKYRIWAQASVVAGESDTDDNTYVDGIVTLEKAPIARFVYSPLHPKPGDIVVFDGSSSTPDGGTVINYRWDFGDENITTTTWPIVTHIYALSGVYNVTLTITDSSGLTNSTWQTLVALVRDVAVASVVPSATEIYVGRILTINVTVVNEGEIPETFSVSLYCKRTVEEEIGTQEILSLPPSGRRTLMFTWNTASLIPGRYTIVANASILLGETDITDNTLSAPADINVKMLGDVNGDGKIDLKDYYQVSSAYGETPGRPRWNRQADINDDRKIDLKDLYIVAVNYGKFLRP